MSVTVDLALTQLAADAKKAGADLPSVQRPGVNPKELRRLLMAAEALAPKVSYPLAPSIRISGPTGQSIVNLKEGRLQFVSWSTSPALGPNPSVAQIVAAVTGEEIELDTGFAPAERASTVAQPGKKFRRAVTGAMLGVMIAGLNGFTYVNARRPPGNFLPKHRLIAKEPAERILAGVAGAYETGAQPGDRRLQVDREGRVVWIKFGADRKTADRKELTTKPASTAEGDGLLTNRQTMIRIKDPTTLVYFGDTYLRVAK